VPEHSRQEGSRENRLSILVVEDSADTAETYAVLLGLHGDGVRLARTGSEALAACRETPPDVILLDIGLPGMDGWEVARQIRQLPIATMPFLIAVTGYGQDKDKRRSAEVGIDLHLTKPVAPDELFCLLERFGRANWMAMPAAERRTAGPRHYGLATATVEGRLYKRWDYGQKVAAKTHQAADLTVQVKRLCHSIRQTLGYSPGVDRPKTWKNG
jgi:CheY-like chemotaxis protein